MNFSSKNRRSPLKRRERILSGLAPLTDLLDQEKCTAWLFEALHGFPVEQATCIGCGKALSEKLTTSLRTGRRVRCRQCGKKWNAWTGTILQGAHISPADFVLFRVALAVGLDYTGLMQLTGRHSDFVTIWTRKVQTFNESQEDPADARAPLPATD